MAAKGRIMLWLFVILHAALVINGGKSKYSQDGNSLKEGKDMKAPFRMMKVNFVWQKALKVRHSSRRLAKL